MSSETMMQALVKTEPQKSYALTQVPIPKPGPGQVLIKMERVSICGSDIPLYKWDAVGQKIAKLPFTPGHECVGIIVELGEGVENFKVGQRVCPESHIPCESCWHCHHDVKGICQKMGLFGHGVKTMHGGCAQYAIAEANAIYGLKTDLSPRMACLLEPFGVSHNALEEIMPIKGEDMLVIGCGPIGLFAIAIAKHMGATKIIAADVVEYRLQKAKEMGADILINSEKEDLKKRVFELTDGNGIGRLFEASGAPHMVNTCFGMLRKGGAVVLVGLPKQPLHVEDVLPDFIFRAITVKTIHGRKMFHTWEESEKLLASGAVNIEAALTHELPMSKFEEAFETLFSGMACKIEMDPQL